MTFACVLKTGGIYTADWVHRLARGVARHLPPHRFVCMTDDPAVPRSIAVPLAHDWPGWWSKLELFRPDIFEGPVLYLDLDTLPVGDLSEIASYRGPLAMLSDFYRPRLAQSGVMAWTPGPTTEALYDAAMSLGEALPRSARGDGEWLHRQTGGDEDRLQDLFPGQIASLKVHAKPPRAKGPPAGVRLVCGHGRPRFSDPAAGWAHEAWRAA